MFGGISGGASGRSFREELQGGLLVNLSDEFLARFLTRCLTRFLTRFLARVLTRVWGRGKTINTVYSTTRPREKNPEPPSTPLLTPLKGRTLLTGGGYAQNLILVNLILVNFFVFWS